MRVCSQKANIMRHISRENLACDVLVGVPHNKSIFRGLVLVLVLNNEAFAGIIVSFGLSASLKLDLKALEVCLVLDHFDKTHLGCG